MRFILGLVLGVLAGYKVTEVLSQRLEERQAMKVPAHEAPAGPPSPNG